jgi:thiamine biosynthesis lipoprotein
MLQDRRTVMGMTARIAVVDNTAHRQDLDTVFDFFAETDRRFSPFKEDSELCRLNRGEAGEPSETMREILALSEKSRRETHGYFDIRRPDGRVDTSGLVKGWAIRNAARMLKQRGFHDFAVEIGGDIQTSGRSRRNAGSEEAEWRVGIRSPFADAVVKILYPRGAGVATSGSYHQGPHIYDPHDHRHIGEDGFLSLTVIGADVMEADIRATAAFAMGRHGINFIEDSEGFEGYAIDGRGIATMTSGLSRYLS